MNSTNSQPDSPEDGVDQLFTEYVSLTLFKDNSPTAYKSFKQELNEYYTNKFLEAAIQAFKASTYQNIDGDAKYWSADGNVNERAMDKFFPQEWFDEKFIPELRRAVKELFKNV